MRKPKTVAIAAALGGCGASCGMGIRLDHLMSYLCWGGREALRLGQDHRRAVDSKDMLSQ